jgi:outer membrane lipoprotein-sorting protein
MKITKWAGIICFIGGITMGTFGCSSLESGNQFSPEQVINNALEETTEIGAYYAEAELITIEKGKDPEKILLKEWVNEDGKKRTETQMEDGSELSIAVNDGKQLISYQPEIKQAFVIEADELQALNQISPKQQAEQLLKMIQDTHEVRSEGEKEIVGRSTYHLIAEAKDDKGLFGDQELWIDKETWMVLKTSSSSGDINMEMSYTKLELSPDFDKDMFTLELPKDVEVQDLLEDMEEPSEITLQEAVEKVGSPFLHIPESSELKIDRIEVMELQGDLSRNEVNIDYQNKGLPFLTMSVFQTPEDLDEEIGALPGEETVKIRNKEASFMDINDFRSLSWQEEGLTYNILFIDPSLTMEEVSELLTEMVLAE